jgi:two-component system, cell cycle sensor histidine kinase and response regulator CckA
MALVDPSGRWLRVNRVLCELVGYTERELLATTFQAITHPDDLAADVALVQRVLAGELQNYHMEKRYITKAGDTVWILLATSLVRDREGHPLYFISQIQDITNRKHQEHVLLRREEQLRRTQHLEAIGQLAGGVAHDLNNMLTAVQAYTALLLEGLDESDPRRDDVERIDIVAERAAALIRQLLAFSRRQMLRPRVFDLNSTVAELEHMLRRLLAENITFVSTLAADLRNVSADPVQIEQVIMNLVVNARDAMPDGGTVSLMTANVHLSAEDVAQLSSATVVPGDYVLLTVSDTGCGMDAETQARMFEPFFTTKELGKGTGLGLSTVYGIVKQSGGAIWCQSEVSIGTTFRVYLPSADHTADERTTGSDVSACQPGSETVLLVEDDDEVRVTTRRTLVREGYRVLTARDGSAALHIVDQAATPIDVVVTDMVMPGMSGQELARQIRLRHPGIRVLFMSGYTEVAALRQSFISAESAFIEKPFAPRALTRAVRDVLDHPSVDATISTID